jgi:hypothetical protein
MDLVHELVPVEKVECLHSPGLQASGAATRWSDEGEGAQRCSDRGVLVSAPRAPAHQWRGTFDIDRA